jgi:leucyl-tRNA---protein transferase
MRRSCLASSTARGAVLMTRAEDEQHFLCLSASPTAMDRYWAEGWRHFGILFFRFRAAVHAGKVFTVLPLRLDLTAFKLTRSQKRVLSVNRDLTTEIRPATIDRAKRALFFRHRERFTDNIPTSLDNFLSPVPDSVPCRNLELSVYLRKRLLGVTFLDVGESATSAVYAIFEPEERRRSLGILMMLQSIQFSRDHGHRYYYPGYAYREPYVYDYKKRFVGLEYMDWETGWRPYPRNGANDEGNPQGI